MIISRKKKFIFAAFNKTGTTSIEQALRPYRSRLWAYLLRRRYDRIFEEAEGSTFKHIPASKIRSLVGDSVWSDYFTFAFIRNPWDRIVSVYFYQRQRIPDRHPLALRSFSEWVRHGGSGSAKHLMSDFVCDERGELIVDFVGRFENLETDCQKVGERLCIELAIPHANKSSHGHYREHYDDETREIVGAWIQRDLEMFDYEF